jgi:GTP-binding protein
MRDQAMELEFVGSFPGVRDCPRHVLPEYAFIGRSNVGKSSLINYLANHASLAKTSKKPGKTQLINIFRVDDSWCMVDLPGYGYAVASKKDRKTWKRMIYDYLESRENLVSTFVLLDSRLELQQIDQEFIQWLGEKSIPFSLVFTKTDGVARTRLDNNIKRIEEELKKSWETLPVRFRTSSANKEGREEILAYIDQVNREIR